MNWIFGTSLACVVLIRTTFYEFFMYFYLKQGSHVVLKVLKMYWIATSVLKTLQRYWI